MEKGNWKTGTASRCEIHVSRIVSLVLFLCLAGAAALGAGQTQPKQEPAKRIDLNKATAEELQQLPDIGPARAKAIIDFREKSGPFRRVEDLLAVPGISKRRLAKIRPFVFVEEAKKTDLRLQTSSPQRKERSTSRSAIVAASDTA